MPRVVVIAVVLSSSSALFAILRNTGDGDPFDSPIYWWTWLLLPAAGFGVAMASPAVRPIVWTSTLITPLIVGAALSGTRWHDPDDGASFWLLGEAFLLLQAAMIWLVATAGRAVGRSSHSA